MFCLFKNRFREWFSRCLGNVTGQDLDHGMYPPPFTWIAWPVI
jgi:hypothetical protein